MEYGCREMLIKKKKEKVQDLKVNDFMSATFRYR